MATLTQKLIDAGFPVDEMTDQLRAVGTDAMKTMSEQPTLHSSWDGYAQLMALVGSFEAAVFANNVALSRTFASNIASHCIRYMMDIDAP